MALKAVVKDINEVAEPFRTEYEKHEATGEFRLKLDGDIPGHVPRAKLDEFRTNNDALKEEIKQAKAKLETLKDIDPEEYQRLKNKKPSETEVEYKNRLDAALKPVQTELETSRTENTKLQGELSKLKINDAAVAAGIEFGLRASAQPDLINRVSAVTKIENGIVIVMDEKGEKRYSSKTGELLSVKELVAEIAEKATFLFEPSTGTNASGSKGGRDINGGPNPWLKEHRNITRQSEIARKDPAQAKRLAAQAGINLNL